MLRLQEQKLTDLLSLHGQAVFRYIVRLVPQLADAEEVFQQTCLTAWKNRAQFDASREFIPWACGIARNIVRNFYRRHRRDRVQLDSDVIEQLAQQNPAPPTEEGYLSALQLFLKRLPQRNRQAVTQYYQGESVQEVARTLSATTNAIYKLLNRSRQRLQTCIVSRLKGRKQP